jgi:pilus assembly protein CpaB
MSMRFVITGLIGVTAMVLLVFAWRLTHPSAPPVPVAEAPKLIPYLAASHSLTAGTLIRNDDFVATPVTPDKLPPGAIVDSPQSRTEIRGALIRRFMDSGTPLLPTDITRPRDRGFLAAVLAPGTRAVSIGVTAITGVAGLIWPGDHVDVLLTQELPPTPERPGRNITSETVLANVRVIAADQDIAQGAPQNGTSAGHATQTVTLQTTVDQAERLAVAGNLGHLSLAVRASEIMQTTNDIPETSVTGADVSKALSGVKAVTTKRVQVVEGDTRKEVTFK